MTSFGEISAAALPMEHCRCAADHHMMGGWSMTPVLISLGSINADFQVRIDDTPDSAETLIAHDFLRQCGGKAANTAFLGALYGVESQLLGRVGNDDLAIEVLRSLQEAGVRVSGISRSTACSTAVSMIAVPPEGKKQIILAPNANDEWSEEATRDVLTCLDEVSRPACLVVDCEINAGVVGSAIARAKRNGVPVVLDPSFPTRVDAAWLNGLTAITPNTEEASHLAGYSVSSLESATQAARHFLAMGTRIACVKLSDGGAVVACEEGSFYIPRGDVPVRDSTGAGDAFTGVLAISLLQGLTPLRAAVRAVAAADLAVTGYGSQPSYAPANRVDDHARHVLQTVEKLHG